VADYRLWNGNVTGDFFGYFSSDDLYVFLDDLNMPDTAVNATGRPVNYYVPRKDTVPPGPNTVAFQNSVVFLPLRVSTVSAFMAGDTAFDYWVLSWYKNEIVDIASPGIDLASGTTTWKATLYDDQDGASVVANYDWSHYVGPNPPCILLLHHHNLPGMRAEKVCLEPELTSDLSITKEVSDDRPYQDDVIVYLITVTNDAATPAPTVIVEDFVPEGVVYNSHTASQGEYSPRSGQWIVGALDGLRIGHTRN
jgi:uncharacterized repeat protein (TIGR01451 family)